MSRSKGPSKVHGYHTAHAAHKGRKLIEVLLNKKKKKMKFKIIDIKKKNWSEND